MPRAQWVKHSWTGPKDDVADRRKSTEKLRLCPILYGGLKMTMANELRKCVEIWFDFKMVKINADMFFV